MSFSLAVTFENQRSGPANSHTGKTSKKYNEMTSMMAAHSVNPSCSSVTTLTIATAIAIKTPSTCQVDDD